MHATHCDHDHLWAAHWPAYLTRVPDPPGGHPDRTGAHCFQNCVRRLRRFAARQRSDLSGEYLTPEELLGVPTPSPYWSDWDSLRRDSRAQQAFIARAYMIVVDNQRVLEPDTLLTLRPATQVEFVEILLLLVGNTLFMG